ncbi:hypothetical protein [Bifidobacterium longum]|uniref:hypothetical protein n=1 Tax=Bifidobacterium longum TaxID=216816 RepID=UPI0011B208DA|nr:hypothetical protein [Bifidobacterium longum]
MSIDLTGKLTEGKTYRVTITGRQSDKVVAKDFQAPAAAAGDDSQVVPGADARRLRPARRDLGHHRRPVRPDPTL